MFLESGSGRGLINVWVLYCVNTGHADLMYGSCTVSIQDICRPNVWVLYCVNTGHADLMYGSCTVSIQDMQT